MTIHPNECEQAQGDLSALLDGELTPERAAEVRAHAAGCSRCGPELAALGRVGPWLARLPLQDAGEAPLARLRVRIAAEDAAEFAQQAPRVAPPPRPRRRARGLVAAALAAAAAIALYLALPRPRPPVLEPEPPVARAVEPPPQPVPAPAPVEEPARIAEQRAPVPTAPPAPATSEPRDPDFDALPADEIAVGLELDTAQDLEVIANLELLEAFVALEEGRG